ncbi:hypothetical protein JOM56_002693 [Amanita muscaria]
MPFKYAALRLQPFETFFTFHSSPFMSYYNWLWRIVQYTILFKCRVGLLHLAVELIQEIGDYLSLQDLKSLRLVCSWINRSIEPMVLSCIVLDVFNHTPTTTMYQLETLASRRSRASQLTRTLKISNLGPCHDLTLLEQCVRFIVRKPSAADEVEAGMRKHLVPAISLLKNVETVIWTMHKHDLAWARQSVTDAIVSLRSLRNLKLIFPCRGCWELPMIMDVLHINQLSNLQKISIFGECNNYQSLVVDRIAEAIAKSPFLTHFKVAYHSYDPPPLQDFFTKRSPKMPLHFSHVAVAGMAFCLDHRLLPHLRALRSLELISIGAKNVAEIYKTLARERIFLSHIVIDNVFPEFLDYLSLHAGILVELSILYLRRPTPRGELDALAERFYGYVLPKHVKSLELLNISPIFCCKWCFNPQHCSMFSQAKQLRSLSVSFPESRIFGIQERNSLDDAVFSIMQLSLTSHFLTKIQINVAKQREWYRPLVYDIPWHSHREDASNPLDFFAQSIRRRFRSFSFSDKRVYHRPLPQIEVFPRRYMYAYESVDKRASFIKK